MKTLIAVFVMLGLFGCGGTKKILTPITQNVVIKPSETMYSCPTLTQDEFDRLVIPFDEVRPDYDQVEIAELLWTLYRNNKICKQSIEQIRLFLNQAADQVEND